MSELTIILTSYNRPLFVEKAILSMLNQTSPNWRLIIQDDGSNLRTRQAIHKFTDQRITTFSRDVTDEERKAKSRYSVLINQTYRAINTGLVGYMCDNVEYDPNMVNDVLTYFKNNPAVWSGYVQHSRDMWTKDGRDRLGKASDFDHWDITPPVTMPIVKPFGMLDHSQVFHRLPISARWEEDKAAVKCGDGLFFQQLVNEHGAIMPIAPDRILSYEHLVY